MKTKTIPDIVYGRKCGMALTMDVVMPEKPTGVGVIGLSSGGWKSFPDVGKPGATEFANHGQTVFIVCHGGRPRFGFLEILADIRRAIRFVRLHAAEYGVSPDRLSLFGISSGGNVSLSVAARGSNGNPEATDPLERISDRVGAVACFYPPTDMANFGQQGKKWIPYRGPEDTVEAVGDDAALAKVWSPVNYFTPAMPPTLIMHGDADELVPIQQAHMAIARLKELGVKHRFEPRPGKPHGWPDMSAEYDLCAEWFDTHLKM